MPVRLTTMLERTKRREEDMATYYFEKIGLVSACNITGRDAVECVSYGIKDDAIQAGIRAADFTSLEDLRGFLARYDMNENSKKNKDNRDRKNNRHFGNNKHPRAEEDTEAQKQRTNKGNCFKCNQPRHYARNYKTQEQKKPSVLSIGSGPKSNDPRFSDAFVNGKQMRAYLDLGSECVTLRRSDALQAEIKSCATDRVLRGFGGSTVWPCGVCRVKLKVDLAEADCDAYIVPDEVQEVALIVGQPFTDLPRIVVVQKKGKLRLFDEASAELPQVDQLPARKMAVWAAEATVIPSNEAADVKVKFGNYNYEGDLFIDLSIRSKPNEEHCIPRCILNTAVGVLPVVNLSDFPLIIKESQIIARAEITREVDEREISVLSIKNTKDKKLPDEKIITVGQLADSQRQRVIEILNEYRDCFAISVNELGTSKLAETEIELNDSMPVYYKPYRLSYAERNQVRGLVDELKEGGRIRESDSPYASPILLVRKKNGEIRMYVDHRALNAKTMKQRFPLPVIGEQVNNLEGAKIFSSFDLASGYLQIPVAEKDVEKTAFVTPDGHYEYLYTPFGLANALAVCSRMTQKILKPLKDKIIIEAYIDDYIIGAEDFESAIKAQVEFLGYEVDKNGIRPGH